MRHNTTGKQIIPVGQDLFTKIRENNFYYVDKTRFIEQLINAQYKVSIISRPHSFGKTMNLSMLKSFFEIGTDTSLFDGLYITGNKELCDKYMGKYPVIFLTFCFGFGLKFKYSEYSLKWRIGNIAGNYEFLNDSDRLSQEDKKRYREISEYSSGRYTMDEDILVFGLKTLSELLYKHFGRKTIILIDAYDVPLYEAYRNGYYCEMRDLISNLYYYAFQLNNYLEFAVLTGCRQLSKDCSLFDFSTFSIDDTTYGDSFGYTEEEVKQLLKDYDMEDQFSKIKDWYSGYHFGNADKYCPWDINNYVSDHIRVPELDIKDYWTDTSSNRIIKTFVYKADLTAKKELEMLMEGKPVTKHIRTDLAYKDITESIDNIWSELYTTGYLTCVDKPVNGTYNLTIPNKEVHHEYADQIEYWFRYRLLPENKGVISAISEGFLTDNTEDIENGITDLLLQSVCTLNATAGMKEIENYYLRFLNDILLMYPEWAVRSKYQSEEGFADILIKPEDYNAGIVIKIKYAESCTDMDITCQSALTEIREKRYDTALREDGRTDISAYGIAFCKKACSVKAMKL